MFSLIIPYHNREKYLPRTLRSIAESTVRPARLFLVDDASADQSTEVCRQFADAHKKLQVTMLTAHRRGAAAARNTALEKVRTEWVYFFDSDDELSPDYFEKATTAAREHPEADVIACQTRMVFENGQEKTRSALFNASPADQILTGQLATQGMWLRTDFLRKAGGWNEQLPKWNDWELGARLLAKGARTWWLRDNAYHRIYQHADSLTGKNFSSTLSDITPALQAVHDLSQKNAAMLFALSCRESALSAHLRREGDIAASRKTRQAAMRTAKECGRCVAVPFSLLIYIYTRLGGRGGWLFASKIARIAQF